MPAPNPVSWLAFCPQREKVRLSLSALMPAMHNSVMRSRHTRQNRWRATLERDEGFKVWHSMRVVREPGPVGSLATKMCMFDAHGLGIRLGACFGKASTSCGLAAPGAAGSTSFGLALVPHRPVVLVQILVTDPTQPVTWRGRHADQRQGSRHLI